MLGESNMIPFFHGLSPSAPALPNLDNDRVSGSAPLRSLCSDFEYLLVRQAVVKL